MRHWIRFALLGAAFAPDITTAAGNVDRAAFEQLK
jgi:hypothetical protein